MKTDFLGDALDHWKGSIFGYLQEGRLLRNFLIDPMSTDTSQWCEADTSLYAQLLRVDEKQLVQHKERLREGRRLYFSEIPKAGDLFLDPDTGIKTGRDSSNDIYKFLRATELFELMQDEKDRLVIVYQHARGVRQRVHNIWTALKGRREPFACSSYEAGTVAMLFFSSAPHRAELIRDSFCRLLGKHSNRRIFYERA
jgi:hypothetical protein